jgi:putative ABC transport system ATP-binding protein
MAFVFQAYNLLDALSAYENVALPARLAGVRIDPVAVLDSLTQVGLGPRAHDRPAQLSGGEQQRIAIARALFIRPPLLFADEPTGALDRATGRHVLHLLRAGVEDFGQTCLMVTHDPVAASVADRVLVLADGQLRGDLHRPSAAEIAARLGDLA